MNYPESVKKQFLYYKLLADKSMSRLEVSQFFLRQNENSNSISVIVKHIAGNMLSRWTDFANTDGEKPWRKRDEEFREETESREMLMQKWEAGWACLFQALDSIEEKDLARIIYIRNEGHTIQEAITRQLAHYPYHVGQIVLLAKQLVPGEWESLSIPKNNSEQYNADKFAKDMVIKNFTEDEIKRLKK